MYSQINGEDHTLPVPPYNCDSSNISAKYVINPQNVGPNIPPKESQNPTQVIYVQVPASKYIWNVQTCGNYFYLVFFKRTPLHTCFFYKGSI